MKAIVTKYLQATAHRGPRASVTYHVGKPKVFSWDFGVDPEDNHKRAAECYMYANGWGDHVGKVELIGAWLSQGKMVWLVNIPQS